MPQSQLLCDISSLGVGSLIFSAPDQNAFDSQLIEALHTQLSLLSKHEAIRVVLIRAKGNCFSSGLNLKWLQEAQHHKQVLEKSIKQLNDSFALIREMDKPVIVLLNGPAYGSSVGLLANADFVIATEESYVCCPEVSRGQIPTLSLPFIRERFGIGLARQLFFTGQRLSSEAAWAHGLISQVVPEMELDGAAESLINSLVQASPEALKLTKELINCPQKFQNSDYVKLMSSWLQSPQSQEGINAFLEKRLPRWVNTHER
jgi:methylglutaconyl-CoA hydratase